eukprot:6194188-Pleurochrysis_carterae.AAC.15
MLGASASAICALLGFGFGFGFGFGLGLGFGASSVRWRRAGSMSRSLTTGCSSRRRSASSIT